MSQPEVTLGPIDWRALAERLGTLRADGESGGSELGRGALEAIVGPEALRAAVDYYVAELPGAQLARSVLALLRPWPAMERCLEVWRGGADPNARRAAVELLRVVADRRALAWVPEFLGDRDEGVQTWGAGVVDQLLWSGQVDPGECGTLLELMHGHPNPGVQRYAELIGAFLARRSDAAEPDAAADRPRDAGHSESSPPPA
jgi:hypothetical protein